MFGAIRHGLGNLANFTGRDARQTFWYYVLFVVVLRIVASLAVSIPITVGMMSKIFEAARSGADPEQARTMAMSSITDMLPQMMWLAIVVGVVSALLLAASFVRRLHDSDLSGWWAAIPLGFQALALAMLPRQMEQAGEMMRSIASNPNPNPYAMMQGQAGMGLIAWVPIVIAIVLGVRKSTDGPNRFGAETVRF